MKFCRYSWFSILPDAFCITILLAFSGIVRSQEGFNRIYDIGRSISLSKIEYNETIGLIMAGVYYNDSSDWQNIILIQADTFGQVFKAIEISDPLAQSHLVIEDEAMFLIDQSTRSILPFGFYNRNTLGLALIDANGIIEAVKEYNFDSQGVIIPYDVLELQRDYLVTGAFQNEYTFDANAMVLKTDSAGNAIWMNVYGSQEYEEYARTITFVNSNFYLLSGTKWKYGENYSVGWAAAIDSLGNLKWEWVADTNEIMSGAVMSLEYDYITNQFKYFTFIKRKTLYPGKNYEVSIPVFVCRDTSMNLLYFKEYGPYTNRNYLRNLEPSFDGWIGVGGTTTSTDDYNSPIVDDFGHVLKLSNDGALIWQVVDTAFFHPILGSRSYLRGITESPSGSIYTVGWANNYDQNEIYRAFGWLLKISPDGCVDTLCTTNSLLDQIRPSGRSILMYPNPATDYVYVEYNYPEYQKCYFELYDLNGTRRIQRMLTGNMDKISLDGINSGLHVWKVADRNGFVLDQGKLMVMKF